MKPSIGPEGENIMGTQAQRCADYAAHLDKIIHGHAQAYRWQSVIVKGGKRYEKEHESEVAAECWIAANRKLRHVKVATILRADTAGINAGKFFLHRILK